MTKQEKLQMYLSFLKEEGINIVNYNSDMVVFEFEKNMYLIEIKNSDTFFALVSNIPIESIKKENINKIYFYATRMNTIKLNDCDRGFLVASETFISEPINFKGIFYMAISAVNAALDIIYEKGNE